MKEFERNEFFHIFDIAEKLEPIARSRRNSDLLAEKTLVTAFYQPSTRTRLAHEAAMHRLGGHVTGFSDAKMTRAGDWYQESIKDTVKMLEFYGDVIVMRHFQQGAPHEAAKWALDRSSTAATAGANTPPVLTDLYTVLREKGRIDGLRWLAVGDMRMRTMHSLGYALTQFDCPITFVAPPDMSLTEEFKSELRGYSLDFKEAEHVEQAIAEADVILVEPVVQPDYTQSRQEAGEHGMTPANYKITHELLEHKSQTGCDLAALAAAHGRDPAGCGHHPLVTILARGIQWGGDADGIAGIRVRRNGIKERHPCKQTYVEEI